MRRLLLFVVIAGCSRSTETSGFRLRLAAIGELAALDPHTTGSYSIIAQDWVFEALGRVSEDGSVRPALASKLERIGTNSVRAWIRTDAKFSDGSQVTSAEVVSSLQSYGLEARSEGGAIEIRARTTILPDATLCRASIFKRAAGGVLGTGPFAVVEQDAAHILLRRTHPVPNRVSEILIRAFPGPREAFTRTLAGDADGYPIIDPRRVEFFEGVPRFRVMHGPGTNAIAVSFSVKRLDRETRLALLANLRGPELARIVYPEGCAPLRSDDEHPARPLPPGRPLNVAFVSVGSQLERMALAVQRALGSRAGEIEAIPYREYVHRIAQDDFDLLIELPIAWPPSDMAMLWHSASSLRHRRYANPKVDAAIAAGDWARAMQELMEDPPVDYICFPERVAIMDSRIKNASIGPFGYFETLPDWEVGK